ncbi:MAG: thiamine phosphate synthase [Gammaproteobacteria bacterium]|nr:thiamine phosphate synthase [Gammaproteobacteria bacterium]MCW8988143.1 thiamine phosphate synthase [Gammaproteobacteria bacterium]MCW9031914.1 thiamine phosphate synthase [Gammaproteobacteria bacterium]
MISKVKSLHGLYAITDPQLMGEEIIVKAEQAILGGINILQYRNKTASPEQQKNEARELAKLCNKHNVVFIINDNVDLAINVNADGVHIGQKDTQLQQARERLGNNKIIGVTCNNQIELALIAQREGADYVAFGRFFTSLTKPTAPQAELSLLSEARKSITIPIVAIGGITHKTAPLLLEHDIEMLAVIQGIFAKPDILNATQQFVDIFSARDDQKPLSDL